MLLYFKTKNFCSFKDEVIFSLKPGKVTERFEDNVIFIDDKLKVSKLAVIVGENAGGKTSFATALDFFRALIRGGDISIRSLKSLCYGFDNSIPQTFEICVLVDKKIYTYSLEIDSIYLIHEELKVRNYNQTEKSNSVVFKITRTKVEEDKEANSAKISMDSDLNSKFVPNQIIDMYENNRTDGLASLFLNVLYTLNVPIVKPFVDWIKNNLIIDRPKNFTLNIYKDMEKNEKDIKIISTPTFLEIFKLVDSTIFDIEIDTKKPFSDTKVKRKRSDGSEFVTKLSHDSTGVNEFFAWAIQIWKVIYENATLFADEMDKVLNVILSSKIINYIKYNDKMGQFIFSTHNIFHLNTIDYMKEQIFFISKDADTLSSEIYTLADFKDYRYDQPEVYNLYLKGLLGATPNE